MLQMSENELDLSALIDHWMDRKRFSIRSVSEFAVLDPRPGRRIIHSSIGELNEKCLPDLGRATDFNRVGSTRPLTALPDLSTS
jgi:hypothetical protein